MTVVFAVIVAALVGGLVGVIAGRGRRGVEPAASPGATAAGRPDRSMANRRAVHIERALADLRLGVIIVDATGDEIYRNNVAQQFATGRHGNAIAEAALQRVIEGALVGLSLEEEIEIYGPPARDLLVQASPTYERGELNGAVGVIDDVTEARHVDRVRRDFIANVSHELRTPIGALGVLAETLVDAEDPEVVERLSERVQREAHRLGDTIADLLSLSRLESGPIVEPETMDLLSVVAMAVERTSDGAAARGVTIGVERASRGPVLVDGDQAQLASAVGNLIDNAVKYSDDGGRVTVTIALAGDGPFGDGPLGDGPLGDGPLGDGPFGDGPLGDGPIGDAAAIGEARAGEAVLAVADRGIGIPERDLSRIFERFYRVDSARSRETGGTGLGLSIVRHAVLNHRGSVEVDSTEGVGTVFVVRLPLSPAQDQVATELAADGREEQ